MDHKYVFGNVGYNLKPLDLQGAIGLAQLKKIDLIHEKRRANKNLIQGFFEEHVPGVRVVREHSKAETSWFGVPVVCESKELRWRLVTHLESHKIQTRNFFAGNILQQPAYRHLDDARKYPNACGVLDRVFFVGCSPAYSPRMLEYLEDVITKFAPKTKTPPQPHRSPAHTKAFL